MPEPRSIEFVRGELLRWKHGGLIDAETYERLDALYAPGLEQELAEDAAKHLALEARVAAERALEREPERAAAVPPAERLAGVGAAAASAVADVAEFRVDEPPPGSAEHEVLEREARVPRRFAPLLYENALWIAGGLLVVFGSLYFLGLIWDHLESVALRAVIAAALHVYAAAFFGVGFALCRRGAHAVGRTLFAFSTVLLPLGSIAAGELASELRGASFGLFVPLVLLGVLATQGPMLALMSGLYEAKSTRSFVTTGLVLTLAIATVAPLSTLAPLGIVLLIAIASAAAWRGLWSASGVVTLRESGFYVGGSVLWFFAVFVARAAAALGGPLTHFAPVAAATLAVLVLCDARLRARFDRPARLTAIGLSLHALVLLALVVSLLGLARQGYFDLFARIGVLSCALVASLLLARAAVLHGKSVMTHLAAGAGLFAYFFLPSPFIGVMQLVQTLASNALGYVDRPLPAAYYGATFLPYLSALVVLAFRLERRRPDLTRDLVGFVGAMGAVAALLAATSVDDLRPMLAIWPIYALGGVALGWRFRRRFPGYVAHALAVGWCVVAGVQARSGNLALLALGAYALAVLLFARARRADAIVARPARFGVWLAGIAALPVAAMLHPAWAPLAVALVLGIAMALGTSRWTSGIVAVVVAVGVTSATALASDRSVAPALVIAATAMFACTAWARRTRVFAGKLTAWRAACGLVFAIGFVMAAARALDSAPWGLVASAGAASFALSWFYVYRSERPARAEPALAAIGLGTACALCFAIEAFVTLPLAARVWLHPFALALASLLVARLGIGWLGTVLGVLPAIGILAALASVLYTCPAAVAGPWLAALAATATAIAVRRMRPLALASACAAVSFAWLALFGPAHLAIPLGLAALPLSLPASLAVSGAALAASHLHVTGPLPLFVAIAVCVRLTAAWRAAPGERRDALARWAGIALLASVVLSVIYAAALLSTGRHPEGAVLAPIALALLTTSVAFTAARARALAGLGRASALLAAGAATAALVACPPPALADVRAVAFVTLALAAGWLLRRGLADRTPWALDGAACALAGGYALARWHGLPATTFADTLVLCAVAHAAFWVRVIAERRGSVAVGPLERIAIGAPVGAALLTPWLSASDAALVLLATAIHFIAMARVLGRRWLAVPGAAAANAALFCALAAIGFHDVLGYALPIALTVLTLVHVHADELGPRGRQVLRALVLVVLYAVCILSTFGTSPLRALVVVPAVCVLAVLAGVLLRVRIYLVLGLAFLAADLGLEMLRHGIASRPLGALFLTVLGLGLVATMVVFSLERERILRRYSVVLGELQTWD